MIRERSKKIGLLDLKALDFTQPHLHTQSYLPWAGLMWELYTVGIDLQDLHYVWVVGTHHMETHLCGMQC